MSIPEKNITNTELSSLPKESLPTMYDLPSEYIEEEGATMYQLVQARLLDETCKPPDYYPNKLLIASRLFIYYDLAHPKWYIKPDWFLVIGVDFLYQKTALRESYVMWQEEISPLIVIELFSPKTRPLAPGENASSQNLENDYIVEENFLNIPYSKWEVYEQILKVSYYFIFKERTNELQYFKLINGKYEEQILPKNSPIWIPELKLGLWLWNGKHDHVTRTWLRWVDESGKWILIAEELIEKNQISEKKDPFAPEFVLRDKEQERLAKELFLQQIEHERNAKELALQENEQLKLQLKQVAQNLLNSGMSVEQICLITGLNPEDIMS